MGVALRCLLFAALLSPCSLARAAASVETVPIDLLPLIEEAASNPSQFAVSVPYAVSTASSGVWSTQGAVSTWSFAVRIREAVSLSFHAPRFRLPDSAILTVRSTSTTATYRSGEAGGGDFWSRVQPGDTLEFAINVPAADRERVILEISSFQAGYRGLSPEVTSHSYIRRVRAQAAGQTTEPCVQNYACNVTPQNSPPAQATVALLVSNLYQCTGTLINNTAQDNTPYVLTARHCQNGKYGGGIPAVAGSVTVYWNAQSSCGADLGTVLYVPTSSRQTGATTVYEQQDAWLLLLDASPVVADAQYAGFDASGAAVTGGYSVHHALSYNRQITRWFGQAAVFSGTGILGTTFGSDLLYVSNESGVIGPGSSGAALFSQNNLLVGSLSLGRSSSSTSGYGNCPASPPVAPDVQNHEAAFISLAALWNSTSDTTSSTGGKTLRSLLDPGNTSQVSVGSMQAARLSLSSSAGYSLWNTPVTLSWNAPNATQCTASGGTAGDGWAGVVAGSGTKNVVQGVSATVTYRLRCVLPGGGNVSGSTIITWAPPSVYLLMTGPVSVWTTRPAELTWFSNFGPCSISGGDLALTGLPISGTTTATSNTAGDVKYTLTCGPAGGTGSYSTTISYVTPGLDLAASGTRRLLGQPVTLLWRSSADTCVPSGGSPGDGWNTSTFYSGGSFAVTPLSTGTFDYGLNCISGPISIRKSVRVAVDESAPFVTFVPDRSSVTLSYTPADYIRFSHSTNLTYCDLDTHGFPLRSLVLPNPQTAAEWLGVTDIIMAPAAPGTMTITRTCRHEAGTLPAVASATATVTVLPPPPPTATLTSSAQSVAPGSQFTLTWSSTYAGSCTATGNGFALQGIQWTGYLGTDGAFVATMGAQSEGTFTFGISCSSILDTQTVATASITISSSSGVALNGSTPTVVLGGSFTLSWNAPVGSSCSAAGGGANGSPWSGQLSTTGSVTQTASTTGTFVYSLACVVAGISRNASYTVTVTPASSGGGGTGNPGSGSGNTVGSGSGGGGATDVLVLAALIYWNVIGLGSRRRRQHHGHQ